MSSILGNLKKGVEQAANRMQEKSHELQLRGQHRAIERERADQIAALGAALYAMHLAGSVEVATLDPQFLALEATERRLDEKQKEIDELVARIDTAAPHPTEGSTPGTTPADRVCSCGAVLSPTARFCPECGQPNTPPEAV
jgi:hypothetical protein